MKVTLSEESKRPGPYSLVAAMRTISAKQSRGLGSRHLGGAQGNWRQDYGSVCSGGSLLGGRSAHLSAVFQTFQARVNENGKENPTRE